MRYSNLLHFSKRHNVLKNFQKSNLISVFWFAIIFIILALIINFSNFDTAKLLGGFFVSLFRMTIAYILALILSLTLALLITANEKIENIALPFFDVMQSFPSFALFPLLVLTIRSSEVVIILVLTISIIWPIMFTIISGIKNRRRDLEEAATIFGATGSKRLFNFTLPELKPSIVTGSIIGWGNGWEFIIGAELLAQSRIGIGSYLGELGNNQEQVLLAFGIAVLLLLIFIINKILWLPLLNSSSKYQSES